MTPVLSRRGLVARLTLTLPLVAGLAACHPTPVRGLRFAEPEEGGSDPGLLALADAPAVDAKRETPHILSEAERQGGRA